MTCSSCGYQINRYEGPEMVFVDGRPVCFLCVEPCEICGEVLDGDITELDGLKVHEDCLKADKALELEMSI